MGDCRNEEGGFFPFGKKKKGIFSRRDRIGLFKGAPVDSNRLVSPACGAEGLQAESVAIKHCFAVARRREVSVLHLISPSVSRESSSRKFLVNGNLPFLHSSSSCLPLPLFGVIAPAWMGRGVPEFREKRGDGALRRLEEVSKGA